MMKFLSRLGDSNEKEIRRLEPTVARINELEPEFAALSDDALRAKTEEFRARLREQLGDLLLPFEQRPMTRRTTRRSLGPTRLASRRRRRSGESAS